VVLTTVGKMKCYLMV